MDTLRGNQYGVAANPNTIKRPNMGSFPMISAIGAGKQTMGVDKLGSKADVIMAKIAGYRELLRVPFGKKTKQIAEAAKAGIKIIEENGKVYAEYPTAVRAKVPADDAFGFMGKRKKVSGNAFSKQGSVDWENKASKFNATNAKHPILAKLRGGDVTGDSLKKRNTEMMMMG